MDDIKGYLISILSEKLGVKKSEINPRAAFFSLGVTSFISEEILGILNKEFGNLPSTLLFEYPNVEKLGDYLESHTGTISSPGEKSKRSRTDGRKENAEPAANKRKKSAGVNLKGQQIELQLEESDVRLKKGYEIAIIGLSGRFPKSADVLEYWNNLMERRDCIEEIPPERWDYADFYSNEKGNPNTTYGKWGGFIDDIDKFDPLFFNISPKEAETMDPQQKLFLMCCWEAMEDAGYANRKNRKTNNVGVYAGVTWNEFSILCGEELMGGEYAGPGSLYWGIPNRVSYFMDFTGPSVAVDSACSSSLTAVHDACHAIMAGDCEMAIAGGVNLNLHPAKYVFLGQGRFLSSEGKCRSFGEGGDGYVPGEGVGAVVLKPLEKALNDGDNIYGVIRGSAANHGGKATGYTVPNPQSHKELILKAIERAEVTPEEINYIECHGTGTALGDPIEIKGLTLAFETMTSKKQFCAIGSVKSNIGHLEAAAGIAGLIKVLLSARYGVIPASLHSEILNEKIDFQNTPFYVVRENTQLSKKNSGRFLAGISSFGAGGSNAHLIVECWNEMQSAKNKEDVKEQIIVLSAQSREQLIQYAEKMEKYITHILESDTVKKDYTIANIAYTLKTGREHFSNRLAMVVSSIDEFRDKLRAFIKGAMPTEGVFEGVVNGQEKSGANAVKAKESNVIASRWVMGEAQLTVSENKNVKNVPLPTYPFLKERSWFTDREVLCADKRRQNSVLKLHPLIDLNVSDLTEQKYMVTFSGREFYLADHHIGNEKVLPAVAYIEMVRAAGELASGKKVQKVRNIVLLSPIKIHDKPLSVYVSLFPNSDTVDFEVRSENKEKQSILHAQGRLIFEEENNAGNAHKGIDIDSVKARCKIRRTKEESYSYLSSIQLNLGRSFQSIEELECNDEEAVGHLKLPAHLKPSFSDFVLHPSLMDGALQVPPAAKIRGTEEIIHLPFTIGEVEIVRPVTEDCYSYSVLSGTHNISGSKVRKFDVSIVDKNGDVLVKIKDFLARPVQNNQAENQGAHEQVNPEKLYYTAEWEEEEIDCKNNTEGDGVILLFDTSDAVKSELLKYINGVNKIILVKPDVGFGRINELEFNIDPENQGDYVRLLEELKQINMLPKQVIHNWSSDASKGSELNIKLKKSAYSVLYLSQALLGEPSLKEINVIYAYGIGENGVEPQYEAIAGMLRTIAVENSRFRFKCMGFVQNPDKTGTIPADVIAGEFERMDNSEVCYRDNKRFVKVFKRFDFDRAYLDALGKNTKLPLKENGVYVITGGTGGLGMIFADYLIKSVNAKIALIGRSDLSRENKIKLERMERQGSQIIYIKADVSRYESVVEAIKKAGECFGKINGIIHSAGTIRDSFAVKKTKDEMDSVLAPKVFGTVYLDEATAKEELDFFVMFSSSTALLGNLGQCDYAYANSFMDSYARLRQSLALQNIRKGKTLSINWPLWREGGMKVEEKTKELIANTVGMAEMETQAGLECFEKGLYIEAPQFMFVQGDAGKIEQRLGINKNQLHKNLINSSDSIRHDEKNQGELSSLVKKELLKIVSEILKIPEQRIDLNKNMSDYGFDSVTLIDFANKVNRLYGSEVTPAVFFEYPTMEAFSNHMVSEYRDIFLKYFDKQLNTETQKQSEVYSKESEITPSLPKTQRFRLTSRDHNSPELEKVILNTGEEGRTIQAGTGFIKEPIAIIGMSGVLPQSEDLETFWKHLEAGHDLIREVPPDRWDWRQYFGIPNEEPNKTNIKWGGFIDDVDKFDAKFFGISPREAELMDPQQRIFIETVWKTIEDAGYRASDLAGSKTGIFLGASTNDYIEVLHDNNVDVEAYTTTGNFHSILANRVSYLLNLNGPNVPVDTACSSSLVAMRHAVESLWSGGCSMAIVGGINLMLHPMVFISFSKAGMLSEDGRCKTFDKRANGYVRAEGAGAVLLKPLSRAIEDKDHIYAVIKGSRVNHGGRVNSLTAPNPNAQAELIVSTFEEGGIEADTVTYMEAHGTGTSLGDPIEINGLKKAFKELWEKSGKTFNGKPYCGIGSVKTNIGHMEAGAGISGLLKVVLAMKNKTIPATINLKELNPYIQLGGSPFYIVREKTYWKRLKDENGNEIPRRAGVSSFGFGGANAHVLIEEFENNHITPKKGNRPLLFVLSAKNEERLKAYAKKMADFLADKCEEEAIQDEDVLIDRVIGEVVETVAQIVNIDKKEILENESLTEYGFDAVLFNEFTNSLSDRLRIDISSSIQLQDSTVSSIAAYITENFHSELTLRYGLKNQTKERISLDDMAYTLQIGREEMPERLAIIASEIDELREKFEKFSQGKTEVEGMYRGNAESGLLQMGLLFDGTEGEEFTRIIFEEKKISKIAQLWVMGLKIQWNLIYGENMPVRMSLPTYPFARERYWVRKNNRTIEKGIHPMLDSLDLKASIGKGIVFKKLFTLNDIVVSHHKLEGHAILPGVGYLEMVWAAANRVFENQSFILDDVVWIKPLEVKKKGTEVFVILNGGNKPGFEVCTNEGTSLTVHAKGGIKLGVIHKTVKQVIPVNTIKDRLKRKVEEKFIYERFKRVGLDYGTYFKGLKEMWFSDNDAIGRIEIASGYEHEMDTFKLHPNLMDAALQIIAMMKLGRKDASARPVMPFTVDCVEYLYPLKTRGFAYVKSDGEERYNVAVTDDNGNVCVKLMGVVVREAKDSMNNFFYRPVWVKEPLDETGNISAGGSNYKKRVLIIYTAVSEKLKQAISKLHVNDELVEIGLGSRKESLSCKEMWINTSSQPELKECIEKQGNIDRIYFLAGLTGLNNMEHSIEVLEENQENGVISLFRLVKALGDLGYSNKPIELKVVTDSAVKVFPEDKINPYPASIFGFCMSMAKEYRSWKVSCIDIDLNSQSTVPFTDSFNDTAKRVVDESPKISGNIAAIRSGKRYVRKLVPIKLPSQQSVPFKQNGVYLILGGAGGIGSELGKYLAENFKANLVLVGRSAFDPAKENLIKDIKAVGGDAIYVEADATNLESMRTVVKNAKRSFGRINGVVHAAIVLKDGIIEMMDEADFRQVMAPKVRGSFILQEVVKEEDIDFMMFFSSTQSFSGHIGQSNYAAACTFKDAYAEYLSGKGGYEVKIVNWGFWGSVGVVATEEYNRRLASQGLYSISPVEGIEAVNRILGGRTVQVAAIKADERYLKSMGVLFDRSIEQYPEIIPATTKMIPGSIEDGLSMDNSTKTAFRELEETLRLLLLDAFRKEGMFLKSGVEYNIKDSAVQLGILPEYNRLFEAMLDILEKSGFIHLRGDWMLTGGSVESEELLAGLNSLASKKAALFEKYEEIRPHLKLISACFEEYFNILRGKVRATDVIFPESSLKLVEGIYISDIVSKYCSNIVAGVLENYIGRRILDLKEGEKINILEVGAGTGSTSKIVFEHLKKYGDKIKYIYSDVSLRFTRFGNSEFGSKYPFTEFRTLDVERDAEEQGYAAGSIDVVLGSNVLHATRNLGKTLGNIKHLLKTNGWLVINEVTQAKEFLTLTFGLLEGWWVYEDDIRLKHSPLLSLEGWENLLKESGFKGTAYSGHASKDGAELSQHVIVAESDGIVFRNVRKHQTLSKPPIEQVKTTLLKQNVSVPERVLPVRVEVNRETAVPEAQPSDVRKYILDCVLESLGSSLGINPSEINLKMQFSSYGVDSIVSIELIKKLNERLGVVLKTITVFDYPNVSELVEYIFTEYGSKVKNKLKVETGSSCIGEDGGYKEQEYIDNSILFAQEESRHDPYETSIQTMNETAAANIAYVKPQSNDVRTFIRDRILECLSGSLGISVDEIDLNKQFSTYGVDSIIGIELIKKLNEAFGVVLKTIAIFDYANVKELSDYVYNEFGEKIKERLGNLQRSETEGNDSVDIFEDNPLPVRHSESAQYGTHTKLKSDIEQKYYVDRKKEIEISDLLDKLEQGELEIDEVIDLIGG